MRIIEGLAPARLALQRKPAYYGSELEPGVRQIIDDVRSRGDAALFDYTLKFDGVRLSALEVSQETISAARSRVEAGLLSALRLAAERIRSFHLIQKKKLYDRFAAPESGQIARPLERVGVYAPGGSACYPSTVLMAAIPARVAGVKEVMLATPPGPDGAIPAPTLVAAELAGVDRVFSIGGAQAIAALAFGTGSVPGVDKICGPGNMFVTLAKKLVYGVVDIDGLEGPSEVIVLADETANAGYCAADLLAQAEHDRLASAVLITTSPRLAEEVNREVQACLPSLPRRTVASESLENQGLIVKVENMDEAIELANLYAPEHLVLMVDNASSYLERIKNAGCIFIGRYSTVVLGDYVIGPSHVLPTGGRARFSSPLSVADFIKLINYVDVDKASLKRLGPAAVAIARAEGLEAHARAVEKRLEGRKSP